MFENRVLRRICALKRAEIIRVRRNLHYEELHNSYSLPSTSRVMKLWRRRWTGHVAWMSEREKCM
jgi:hypothetical protein